MTKKDKEDGIECPRYIILCKTLDGRIFTDRLYQMTDSQDLCPKCKEQDSLIYYPAQTSFEMDVWVCEKCRCMIERFGCKK